MATRRKVIYRGSAFYVGANLERLKVPMHCVRDGEVCAYRIKMIGMTNLTGRSTACGYLYYTGRLRGCDPKNCIRYSVELPEKIMFARWEQEDVNASIYDE